MIRNRNRRLNRHTTRMLGGLRRPPPPDHLAIACRCLEQVVRSHKRMIKLMPEYHDPNFLLRRLQQDQEDRVRRAALDWAYGCERVP